jgi:hypothetical protein
VGRCQELTDDECFWTGDCDSGFVCTDDDDVPQRCVPDMDVRGLVDDATPGRSFHCACDAECPGAQSCVRMEFGFTAGFCAFRCADARDCPDGWTCLGETSSGLEAICLPPQ